MKQPIEVHHRITDIGTKPPLVTITMDVWAWDFILESISLSAQSDELVKVIRKACKEALQTWLPSVHQEI